MTNYQFIESLWSLGKHWPDEVFGEMLKRCDVYPRLISELRISGIAPDLLDELGEKKSEF